MTRRRFLSTGLAMSALAGCAESPRARLRVGTYLWPGYEPLFLARHLGKLDPKAIQIAEYPTASELMLSFQNRALDVVTLTQDDVVRLVANGQDLRIVHVISRSHGGDALVGQKDLPDVAALRGKTIGFEANTLGAFFLAKALEHHGVGIQEVTLRPWRVDRLNRQFHIGEVDAVVTYEPFRSHLVRAGARVLFDSSQIPGEVVDVLLVRPDLLENQLPALREMMAGWWAGLEFLRQEPAAAAAVVAPRERTTPASFLASLDLFEFVSAEENRRLLAPPDSTLPDLLLRTSEFMLRHHLLPRPVVVPELRSAQLTVSSRR